MKRMGVSLLVAVAVLLALLACQQPVAPPTASSTVTALNADARAGELVDLIVTARATGDFAAVNERIAEDDPSGELAALVAQFEAEARTAIASAPAIPVSLPGFTDDRYRNGDVLVCRGSSSAISDVMSLVLNKGYGHGGILDLEVFDAIVGEATSDPDRTGNAPCILSADIDYLTDPANHEAALNYETYNEWVANNDIITVLHGNLDEATFGDAIASVYALHPGTNYAFIDLRFNPVPRESNSWWYCSKVPWRVYATRSESVENAAFYSQNDRWTALRDSLLYKVYRIYVRLAHPFWPSSWVAQATDAQLKYVLTSLVTPDELRTSALLAPAFCAVPGALYEFPQPPLPPSFADMGLVGWSL